MIVPRKLNFPAVLTPNDQGGFIVSFPDMPEAITEGASRSVALENARDALAVALLGRIKDGTSLPSPSPAFGRPTVTAPMESAAKIEVIERWHISDISESELATRIGCDNSVVRRILNPQLRTKIRQIEDALAAMGRHLVIGTCAALEAHRVGAGANAKPPTKNDQPLNSQVHYWRQRYSISQSAKQRR